MRTPVARLGRADVLQRALRRPATALHALSRDPLQGMRLAQPPRQRDVRRGALETSSARLRLRCRRRRHLSGTCSVVCCVLFSTLVRGERGGFGERRGLPRGPRFPSATYSRLGVHATAQRQRGACRRSLSASRAVLTVFTHTRYPASVRKQHNSFCV